MPNYVIQRNKNIYEDADSFKPSRWENPSELEKSGFLPFAVGQQNCAGQALANAELHCVLARLIQEYDFSVEEEGTAEFSLILKPVGLKLKATRVKQ